MSEQLTPEQMEEMQTLLAAPIHYPDEFKRWLLDQVALNIPLIPFSSIFGSKINLARSGAYVQTSEATTSASYTDLSTVGPEVTELANGTYLVGYGVRSRNRASISVNGATPSDDDSVFSQEASTSNARMQLISLTSNNSNSIRLQYKNGTFSHRWLFVIRIGAPS